MLQVRRRIQEDVESGVEQQQREYILRKQLESIRKELGEDEASVVEEYRAKIEDAGMPEAVRGEADSELSRLERMGDQTPEATVIRNYLDWLLAVPWSKRSEERLDPQYTREKGSRIFSASIQLAKPEFDVNKHYMMTIESGHRSIATTSFWLRVWQL